MISATEETKHISDDRRILVKVALLEQSVDQIQKTLDRIDKRFDYLDKRFDNLDKKIEKIDMKIDRTFKWVITTVISIATLFYSAYQIFIS